MAEQLSTDRDGCFRAIAKVIGHGYVLLSEDVNYISKHYGYKNGMNVSKLSGDNAREYFEFYKTEGVIVKYRGSSLLYDCSLDPAATYIEVDLQAARTKIDDMVTERGVRSYRTRVSRVDSS